MKTRYCTIEASETDLAVFDRRLRLSWQCGGGLAGEIDSVVEHAEQVLGMWPDRLHVTIIVMPDSRAVEARFQEMYNVEPDTDTIAFYSLSKKTIYISADDTSLKVLAHELGHAIAAQFFTERPPFHIHELLAQYTEKHIND